MKRSAPSPEPYGESAATRDESATVGVDPDPGERSQTKRARLMKWAPSTTVTSTAAAAATTTAADSPPAVPAAAASGSRTPRPIGLGDIPLEVRMRIYDHLFVKDYAIRPLCHEDRYMELPGTGRPPGLADAMGLVRTCRFVHAEATEVLYGRNSFLLYALDFGEAVLAFLQQIGKANRHTIRTLELDWQHGITRINHASKASVLVAMISDLNNPLRKELAKMLHDVGRTAIRKFVAALELLVASPRLTHLAILCPGRDNPGHPDNHIEFHGCPGCHRDIPRVLAKIRGLRSLTVGDSDCREELEGMARRMGVRLLRVTQLDCVELPPEVAAELERDGWTITISWRDPDGDDFRRSVTKHLAEDINRRPAPRDCQYGCGQVSRENFLPLHFLY